MLGSPQRRLSPRAWRGPGPGPIGVCVLCGQRRQRFGWPALSETSCRREGRPPRPWPGRLEAAGTAGERQAAGARDRGARRPRASQLGAGCWLRDGRWGQSASREGGAWRRGVCGRASRCHPFLPRAAARTGAHQVSLWLVPRGPRVPAPPRRGVGRDGQGREGPHGRSEGWLVQGHDAEGQASRDSESGGPLPGRFPGVSPPPSTPNPSTAALGWAGVYCGMGRG